MEINSDKELNEALDIVEKLLERDDLTDDEDAYLDQLIDVIEAYESIHYPMPKTKTPPKHVIEFLFEQNDLSDKILSEQTNLPEETITALRIGERIATDEEASVLGQRFCLDPSIFQEDGDA